ncbi:hypothetical protein CXB51_000107 [Gossypium anomalum]|uniref:Uncharacterized protein n=1 Tax=Gossypium anomalum TaxID=47600 RepID=A0A8J5ZIU8_9ROSI|nr:hypothetical protein CXB51_000107 [Gossypium anomalum]
MARLRGLFDLLTSNICEIWVKTMAPEDQTHRCSNNSNTSGGNNNIIGKSSKKQRPKKVPQRGLGVAQLEKIRLEEQQKKDPGASLILPLIPSFHPPNHPSSSSSSSSSSIADVSPPPTSFFRPQNIDGNTSAAVPLTSSVNGHKFWGSCCEFNIEKGCPGLDPGWIFRTNLSLPYESEPVWSLPSLMQRGQPFHQHQPPPSMMNLSSRTSSSTSVMNIQTEPPSNQKYYKNYTPLLPEEKVIGMKRPYPFSLDNAPGPPLHTKYPPIVHSIYGQIETTSSTKDTTFNFEPDASNFSSKEGPSCSTSNGVFTRDFLTLGPPATTSMCSTSKSKHPPSNPISYELPDLDSLVYHQASFGDSIMKQGGGGFTQHRPYYSFFPPAMAQIEGANTVTMANCKSGEVAGHVDLNLKL